MTSHCTIPECLSPHCCTGSFRPLPSGQFVITCFLATALTGCIAIPHPTVPEELPFVAGFSLNYNYRTQLKPAKPNLPNDRDAKPRVLAPSATFDATKAPKITGLQKRFICVIAS